MLITHLLKENVKLEWTEACLKTFEELRDKLSLYPILRPSDWNKPFHVYCNASNVAVGSALCQSTEELEKDQPIAYARKQLTPAERNYSTTKRECLAMVFSMKKFKPYLLSNPVVFFCGSPKIHLNTEIRKYGSIFRILLRINEGRRNSVR